jgi:hypothetical protein
MATRAGDGDIPNGTLITERNISYKKTERDIGPRPRSQRYTQKNGTASPSHPTCLPIEKKRNGGSYPDSGPNTNNAYEVG